MRQVYLIYIPAEILIAVAESKGEAWLMAENPAEVERVERVGTAEKGIVGRGWRTDMNRMDEPKTDFEKLREAVDAFRDELLKAAEPICMLVIRWLDKSIGRVTSWLAARTPRQQKAIYWTLVALWLLPWVMIAVGGLLTK